MTLERFVLAVLPAARRNAQTCLILTGWNLVLVENAPTNAVEAPDYCKGENGR